MLASRRRRGRQHPAARAAGPDTRDHRPGAAHRRCVREALRAVLDNPAYARAAAHVQAQIAAAPDITETAHAIEQLPGVAQPGRPC